MAKVEGKVTQTGHVRNYAKTLMFQPHRTIPIVRRYIKGKIKTANLQVYNSLVYNYIINAWNNLTQEEKEFYEELAKNFYVSGLELFTTETQASVFGTKYKQGIYGLTRYSYG